MNKKALSERDICSKFITPALQQAGCDQQNQIREELTFTAGRVIVRGRMHTRGEKRRADGTSSSMKNVSRGQIQNLVIPLPPLKEQEKILNKVNELGKICDGLVCKLISVKQTQAVLAHVLVEQVVA